MHGKSGFDFTKFVPGFDFLKNLGGGASAAPAASGWVAPTLDPAELDKRIQELKTVHFWLDQNTKAVSATIQALEVQRMTLVTLQSMNVGFAEMAEALKLKPEAFAAAASAASPDAAPASDAGPASEESTSPKKRAAKPRTSSKRTPGAKAQAAHADPAQWWGALTDQFQNIASTAMQEMAKNAATHPGAPASDAPPAKTKPVKPAEAAKPSRAAASKRKPAARRTSP